MRLPGGPLLSLESRGVAAAIAAEWQLAGGEKGGSFTAEDVPLTRIAGTAQERVAPDPEPTIAALTRFGETDLICYQATHPAELVALQAEHWQPWLDWARTVHGAEMHVARGVMHQKQPQQALAALRHSLSLHPPFVLAGLGILVPALGSLILGLAVADDALAATAAHDLALLDELFQAEKWGDDREALTRRRVLQQDVETAAHFITLSRSRAA